MSENAREYFALLVRFVMATEPGSSEGAAILAGMDSLMIRMSLAEVRWLNNEWSTFMAEQSKARAAGWLPPD